MSLSATHQDKPNTFWQYCLEHQYFNIGYPEYAGFDYSPLFKSFKFSLYNCGDWREPSNYVLSSLFANTPAWRPPNFITTVFPRSSEHVWRAFNFAVSGDKAHLITMPHHKAPQKLDQLIDAIILDQSTLPKCSTYI